MENKNIIIIGAGIGGLCTALRLAKKGYQVTILEKNKQPGGRLNQIKKDGFTFDIGPSFFSMSYEFKEFADECGIDIPFEFIELDPLYTVNFKGSEQNFFLYKDIDKLAAQFEPYEPHFKEKFQKYLKECAKTYDDTAKIVIKQNFNSLFHYVQTLLKVNPYHVPKLWRTFWDQVIRYFDSKEAQQIVSLVSFFLGRTPFDTPAIYTLLSHIEFQHDGYYNVKGGMYKIVEGLVNELEKENVKIHYETEVVNYESDGKKITAFIDQNGKKWNTDVYVVNSDAALFRGTVLKNPKYSFEKLSKKTWTMGYLTFYLGIEGKLESVNHHNYYLGRNFNEYAKHVLRDPGVIEKPYYYVNVVSKYNEDCAPAGCESLFFVCPVPSLQYKKDWNDKEIVVQSIIDDFSERIGIDINKRIISKTIYTPIEWQEQFRLHYGSGLGLSHNIFQIGGLRPSNKDKNFENVFYVGASTVPGAGLPMSVIGSKLAFERVEEFYK
ncbi:MAG TPA: phytoene desaturase family protein [Bacteroidales bacterium]|nr:phytoene desaturase family protein [Bacteroidales bacterium]HPS70670.1 phytoene desaturase family protein [Bacteroidales bacterium]